MIAFKDESQYSVEFERKGDGLLIHFGEDVLGINPNRNDGGFSLTPDWNDQHLTLAFSESSVLYHLTNEVRGDRPGEGNLQPEAFVADIYSAVRSLGPLIPIDRLELEEVGIPDFDEIETYLKEKEVITRTGSGVSVDRKKQQNLVSSLTESEEHRHDFFDRVLSPIPLNEAVESGENIFAVVGEEEVFLLFLFPDEYVSIVEIREFYARLELLRETHKSGSNYGTGSQVLNFLSHALAREE